MGGANSVGLPGTHLNSVANTHNDPIVRSSESSLNGKLVVADANTNARNVSSAPSIIGEYRGHATMVANSVLTYLDNERKHGDRFHEKAKRYKTTKFMTMSSTDLYKQFDTMTLFCDWLISHLDLNHVSVNNFLLMLTIRLTTRLCKVQNNTINSHHVLTGLSACISCS